MNCRINLVVVVKIQISGYRCSVSVTAFVHVQWCYTSGQLPGYLVFFTVWFCEVAPYTLVFVQARSTYSQSVNSVLSIRTMTKEQLEKPLTSPICILCQHIISHSFDLSSNRYVKKKKQIVFEHSFCLC